MLHLGIESRNRFFQAVGFVHESWHRWKTGMDANPWQTKASKLFSLCGVSVITSWQCNYLIAMNNALLHLQQRLSQKRYCLKFLSSKFDFEEQSAAIWRQLVETHPTAACLSALLPFFIPRAQESSLLRAQQHRPIVVYNPQQQVINYIRAQFKNQRLTGLSAFLSPCKIPSAQHSQSVK